MWCYSTETMYAWKLIKSLHNPCRFNMRKNELHPVLKPQIIIESIRVLEISHFEATIIVREAIHIPRYYMNFRMQNSWKMVRLRKV